MEILGNIPLEPHTKLAEHLIKDEIELVIYEGGKRIVVGTCQLHQRENDDGNYDVMAVGNVTDDRYGHLIGNKLSDLSFSGKEAVLCQPIDQPTQEISSLTGFPRVVTIEVRHDDKNFIRDDITIRVQCSSLVDDICDVSITRNALFDDYQIGHYVGTEVAKFFRSRMDVPTEAHHILGDN